MEKLTLMSIKDRTWNIQACSAVTKEGKNSALIVNRTLRGNGMARKDSF